MIKELIVESEAEVVVIDSITRLNTKKLEDSSNAEYITRNLRSITYETGVTLICIHHTHKMRDSNLTMDSIKGSSTFAQEIDFAIGIARSSKGHRYFKDVVSRYASVEDQLSNEFEIDSNKIINQIGTCDEDDLLSRTDGRKSDREREMTKFFRDNKSKSYPLKHLVIIFIKQFGWSPRSVKDYAMRLYKEGILENDNGVYRWKGGA
ncbi:hypothetical protein AAU57_03535 [Nonlabens sp. YIK11]|uniref:AAA family ATPase n=1 Tax=Nonlabens sp. YIK11 TaxID=1453349 RepID=UPI0006DD03F9|nr:AAA family ATPase [Nonlabens sp. YIK11]KQC32508.1 hypothetical protein AAU57_03535 [Nonlabens sp. YIK11]